MELVHLPGPGMDWLMRPVLRGLCSLKDYLSGEYLLDHVALLNDALDVMDENQRRMSAKD